MASSLSVEQLSHSYGERVVLQDITFDVAPGELFFLLGPSGSGKTTLLRCLAGLCQADRGRIRLDGQDITHLPPHRRAMAMVFQSYALWPHMTVWDNVAFPLRMQRRPAPEIRERTEEVLRNVRLLDRAQARPGELSGGQQQRVALARALVAQPKCLLLDEPLSNLDARLRVEMRNEIRRLCKELGLTTVYVTHDQKEAMAMADRLAVLHEGCLVQCGQPDELYRRPANRFVAQFIGEANLFPGTVEDVNASRVVVRTAWGEWVSEPSGWNGPSGSSVTVAVRPEVIRICPTRPTADPINMVAGVVEDTSSLGEVTRQRVRVGPPDRPLLLDVYELRPTVQARDGRPVQVWLRVDPKDVIVVGN